MTTFFATLVVDNKAVMFSIRLDHSELQQLKDASKNVCALETGQETEQAD